jgi:hypothetical protein
MTLTPGQRGILAILEAAGGPITRERYIALAYGDEVPDPWTPEDEAELPDFLQDGGEPQQQENSDGR